MSRNLGRTNCWRCYGAVKLTSAPRLIGADDCGVYFPEYQGMRIADAECGTCGARYLAWVTSSLRMIFRRGPEDGPGFFDLSFRSTFNDEPGPEDLPSWERSSPPALPAAAHPAPWRWEGVEDFVIRNGPHAGQMAYSVTGGLVDRNGAAVASVSNSNTLDFASPRVRELLRAAPELAAMLRKLTDVAGQMTALAHNEYACKPDDFAEEFAAVKDAEALLDRIDKAGKAGE